MINQETIKEIRSQQKPFIKNLNRFCCLAPKFNQSPNKELNEIASVHASICDNSLTIFPTSDNEIETKLESVNISANYFEQIKSVSKEWSEQPSFKEALLQIKDNDQCFFITDLPIEWLQKNNVPLSFMHDTCKLPYANGIFHEQYFEDLQKARFTISKEILDKTLVLMCSPNDSQLNLVYDDTIKELEKIGFHNYKKCFSKEEFKHEINTKQPDILLIDTHGNYHDTDEDSSSFIAVCDEIVSGDDIGMLSYAPKIVYLSACNTRPVKTVEDCIVDAFIKRGCLAVTASYVELDADQEFLTIVRFINNLKQASNSNYHPNWLSFISHLKRTFFVQTLKLNFGTKEYSKNAETLLKEIDYLQTKTEDKGEHALFECVREKISTSSNSSDILGLEQTLVGGSYTARMYFYPQWLENCMVSRQLCYGKFYPEHIYFTNYGRMDLIPFDVADPQQEIFNNVFLRSFHRVEMMRSIEEKEHLIQKYLASKQSVQEFSFGKKIGRNDPCPCGSGRKYKKCCGK